MSLEWKTVELKSIANVTMGQSPKSEFYNDNFEGMPFLQGNKTFGDKYPSFELYTTSIKKVAEKNSVLMSVRAPVGDLNIAQEDICIGRGVCGLQMKKGDNEFLYYLLKANISHLINKESGTVFGSINKNDIETFEVTLPKSSDDQMKILTILKNIDKKIDICKNLNRNLLQLVKTIFKNWFVDFGPFDGIQPDDWRICSLEEICDLKAGGDKPTIVSDEKNDSCIYPIYSNGLDKDGLYGYTDQAKIFDESVTVSARGTIGFVCLRHEPYVPIVRLVSLIPNKNKITAKYLYLALERLNIIGTGTTQQQLTIPDFKKTEILLPTYEVIESFTYKINPIFNQIWTHEKEIIKLSNLRDILLPKLMSGEIDVSKINCDMQQISTNNWDNKFTVPLQNNLIKVIS